MAIDLDPKSVERRVFRATFDDGLWDILIAGFALMFALAPFLARRIGDLWSAAIFIPFWGVLWLAIWLARKYVVMPRRGTVQLNKRRKRRLWQFTLVMLALNIVAFVAGIIVFVYLHALSGQAISVVFGVALLAGFSLAGYYLDCSRLYVYGLMAGIAPSVGEWLYSDYGASHHGFPITFGIICGVTLLVGAMTFVRFLRNNPADESGAIGS